MSTTKKEETFYLGFTMAGAVSAGSYTGGILDYLFEVLNKWEKAKEGKLEGINKEDVPSHNVVIDAMGGTSAGGMTTSMATLYAIKNEINPITDDEAERELGKETGNILYDSWVNLIDENDSSTIEKALTNDDIKRTGTLRSFLNSDFINEIASKAFKLDGAPTTNPVDNLPSYISKDLELLISHTMLRGIPLEVSFSNNSTLQTPPSHSSYEHFLMSHFKLNNGNPVNENNYMWLNPYNKAAANKLMKATIATGAFPIGLNYLEFDNEHFGNEYLKTMLSRLITKNMGEESPKIKNKIAWKDSVLNNYKSMSVDGGAINNEPYSEVISLLKNKRKRSTVKINGQEYQKYGMVMIDPFPDFHQKNKAYKAPKDLLGVIPLIIKTLWNQSKIKRSEMIEQFNDKAYRGVIFPMKHMVKDGESIGLYDEPLATGMMGGFSGFLDIKFRHHDFFLGRNNARNFIRAFLSLPYNDGSNGKEKIIHPVHRSWTKNQVDKFIIILNGETYLPIIPDMNMLINDVDSKAESLKYTIPDTPQIKKEDLFKLKKPLKNRINAIISILLSSSKKDNQSCWRKALKAIPKWIGRGILRLGRKWAASYGSKKAINYLYDELGKAGFIEGYNQAGSVDFEVNI
ncbi:patatin-like phospholipase family protein [Prolixibacteraceae bacterium Z1-6]|uniref:Patatin-like phospholipase family protein n=1 Tax=Draconibacterium aestuarii TaxID=2998507 RepID=A0A9X3J564_9BACT|nr:patatin-like phospholipase family protein [Prolixibacteraceae bacterium Z1-6]